MEMEGIYLSLHFHHQNDFCIKMGSDESHFNVSVGSDGQSHKTVSTNHNLFEEKGEPKRYRSTAAALMSMEIASETSSVLLYIHRNHKAYQGRDSDTICRPEGPSSIRSNVTPNHLLCPKSVDPQLTNRLRSVKRVMELTRRD